MDKFDLFRELGRFAAENDLNADETRLYLLLLANCRGVRRGRIEYVTIKSAIGGDFSPLRLQKACQHLFARNLIALTSVLPDDLDDKNFILSYLILPTGES